MRGNTESCWPPTGNRDKESDP